MPIVKNIFVLDAPQVLPTLMWISLVERMPVLELIKVGTNAEKKMINAFDTTPIPKNKMEIGIHEIGGIGRII